MSTLRHAALAVGTIALSVTGLLACACGTPGTEEERVEAPTLQAHIDSMLAEAARAQAALEAKLVTAAMQ